MDKKLMVISGPSGAGIGPVLSAVFARREDTGTALPVTARKPKAGEQDGAGLRFYDLEGWNALKESGDLLEWTEFAGNDYGTSRREIEAVLAAGRHVLLSLPVQRAALLKHNYPRALCVYLEPSPAVLRQRYEALSHSPLELAVRLDQAERERALSDFCDARVSSDDLDAAAAALEALLDR